MKSLLAIGTLMVTAASAHANGPGKLVGYQCDEKANAVIITYANAPNDAGKKAMKNKGLRQWNPWSLIVLSRDKVLISSMKTVHGECKLADGIYGITFGPLPGNSSLQGMCGGFMSAWAEVKRGSEVVLPRHAFESGDCHNASVPVTVKIIIESGGKKPAIEKVPRDDFYKRGRNPSAANPAK